MLCGGRHGGFLVPLRRGRCRGGRRSLHLRLRGFLGRLGRPFWVVIMEGLGRIYESWTFALMCRGGEVAGYCR